MVKHELRGTIRKLRVNWKLFGTNYLEVTS